MLQKIIDKPVVIPKYVDRYVDKIVDVKVEVVVPKVIEVPRQQFVDKIVDVGVRAQRVHFRERAQTVPINTILKKNTISAVQKRRFQESSVQLANMVVEHEQLKAEAISLRERVGVRGNIGGLAGVNASAQENERLKRLIYELETSLRQKETERNRLRQTTSTTADVEVIQQVDSQDIPRLQAHIQRVRAENENLRRISARGTFGSQRKQVGTRVSHQDVRREAPVHLGAGGVVTTGRAVSSGPTIRRSAGYATTSTVVGAPATTYVNQGQTVYPGGGVIRTSHSNTQVVRTSGGYGNTTYVGGGSPSTGVITTGAYPTTGVISSTGVRTSGGYTTGVSPGYTTTVGGAGGVIRRSGTHTTNVVNTGIPTNTFVNRY